VLSQFPFDELTNMSMCQPNRDRGTKGPPSRSSHDYKFARLFGRGGHLSFFLSHHSQFESTWLTSKTPSLT
jgi:hypothetical protein